jgi:3-hydroxyisobutyrate dehydrogenase-like beta-hydroxyacid dehydrogenase
MTVTGSTPGPPPATAAPGGQGTSPAPADLPPVALLGLGSMGAGMGLRLRDLGAELTVFNRTASRAAPLVAAGAIAATSAAACLSAASVVLVSLADEQAVEEVLLTPAAGLLAPGTHVIDTSTVSPAFARAAAARLAALGVHRVEACAIGNPFQARAGELRLRVAGDPDAARRVAPVLDALAGTVTYLGPAGQAAVMKLTFNLLLGAQVAGLAEAVSYGVAAGLDRSMLLRAIGGSGFSSKVLSFRADLMRERRYEPAAFRSALMHKDLSLGVDAARQLGVRLPVLSAVAGRFADLVAAGDADLDAAALIELQQRGQGGAPG